jgi:hypothetical protein
MVFPVWDTACAYTTEYPIPLDSTPAQSESEKSAAKKREDFEGEERGSLQRCCGKSVLVSKLHRRRGIYALVAALEKNMSEDLIESKECRS